MGKVVSIKNAKIEDGGLKAAPAKPRQKGGRLGNPTLGQQPQPHRDIEDDGENEIPQRRMSDRRKIIEGTEAGRPDQAANPKPRK